MYGWFKTNTHTHANSEQVDRQKHVTKNQFQRFENCVTQTHTYTHTHINTRWQNMMMKSFGRWNIYTNEMNKIKQQFDIDGRSIL